MVYKLFGLPLSPYVSVASTTLEVLGVEYEQVPVRPHNDDPEFIKASPLGKIPALVDGDFYISDSTAIAVYVDTVVNANGPGSLFGSDAKSKARIAFIEKYTQNDGAAISAKLLGHAFQKPDDVEGFAEAKKTALTTLEFLNSQIQDNGHFVGSSYTIADIVVYSHLTTYQLFETLDADKFPKLVSFYKKASEVPAFAKPAAASKAIAAQALPSK